MSGVPAAFALRGYSVATFVGEVQQSVLAAMAAMMDGGGAPGGAHHGHYGEDVVSDELRRTPESRLTQSPSVRARSTTASLNPVAQSKEMQTHLDSNAGSTLPTSQPPYVKKHDRRAAAFHAKCEQENKHALPRNLLDEETMDQPNASAGGSEQAAYPLWLLSLVALGMGALLRGAAAGRC